MNRRDMLFRKVLAVVSCIAVILSMVVAAPVKAVADDQYVMIDIVVYFNDAEISCFDYVLGEQVKVTGPGTYTATFDCAQNLTYEQTSAGVTGLNNIGAIYLIDDKRYQNVTRDSIVNSFDFTYDSVKIDGVEVELSNHDERSGLKDQGQIDTNGPINAWEDCQLAADAYTVADFSLNFAGFENPQVIEITFTVTNMEFKEVPTTEEPTTEESTTEEETTEEPTTEEATTIEEASEEESSSVQQTTAAAAEEDESGSGMTKIILVVALVLVLAVVLVVALKKLRQQ